MSGRVVSRPSDPGRPLTIRAILVGGVLVGAVGAAAVAVLLYFYGDGTEQDQAGLDVVRTAGTLMVGTGGVAALILAARRQRSTELTLEHQREVAEEQRITELYTRAVDQLGNDQAPVRLGGLHALERLAQKNPAQRQTIVDVMCAYLRMPYTPPAERPPDEATPSGVRTQYEHRRQELQVRLTAQRILTRHLKPDAGDTFWPDIDLDLTEAHLHDLNLAGCHIRNAQFSGTQFAEKASFCMVQFFGDANFGSAKFDEVEFDGVQFTGDALFSSAQFSGRASFNQAQFIVAWFNRAQFDATVVFTDARFSEDAEFGDTRFTGAAWFIRTQFLGYTLFGRSQFSGKALFAEAQFADYPEFEMSRARPPDDNGTHAWPKQWATREAREGEEGGWLYLVSKY